MAKPVIGVDFSKATLVLDPKVLGIASQAKMKFAIGVLMCRWNLLRQLLVITPMRRIQAPKKFGEAAGLATTPVLTVWEWKSLGFHGFSSVYLMMLLILLQRQQSKKLGEVVLMTSE